ncbi:hypothetical protein CEP53_001764 [Fusarium sp. AF-6]|nr:hypothetical protein CEP53_001764 [Fusarium sp. AF-6]
MANLARLIRHVRTGPRWRESKHTSLDIKIYVRLQANQRGWDPQLKPSDLTNALLVFGVIAKKSKSVGEEELVGPRQVDVDDEEKDEVDVDESVDEGEQHNRAGDMENGRDEEDGDQTSTSSEANMSPIPVSNSQRRVPIRLRLVSRQNNSSPPKEVITLDHAEPPSSDSPKKRTRSEEPCPGLATVTPDRPTKRCRLNIYESNTDPGTSAPTLEDPAAAMIKGTDLATLHAAIKRRQAESSLEYTTLKKKVDMFQDELEILKSSLEAGTSLTMESRSELAKCEKALEKAVNDFEKVRRTIEDYATNKDLLGTLGVETRRLIEEDHRCTINDMVAKRNNAKIRLNGARRRVEAEREEAKKRIEEDETKLVKMKADLELAHTESDLWGCIENLTVMKAVDLKRVVAGLEKEGVTLLECPEKQG